MADGPVIRPATLEDLPALLSLAARFVSETQLPLTYDAEASTTTLLAAIQQGHYVLLVEEEDGVISGAIMGVVDRDFCREACAYVLKMYVEREFRGLGTARALVGAFEAAVAQMGASVVFAAATAGMGDEVERLYVRLFQRYGYAVLGRVLVREI